MDGGFPDSRISTVCCYSRREGLCLFVDMYSFYFILLFSLFFLLIFCGLVLHERMPRLRLHTWVTVVVHFCSPKT